MPTYIIGSRDTGPSLADFLTGVNQSIGLYANQRNNQIRLDQAAAAAQAEQDRWNDEYMLDQRKFGLDQRKFNEYDLPMLGVNQFEAQTGRQRLGLDRDIYENVSLPGVRIDQQNADTTRMTENRAGALQDRRFGLVDQAASAPETMRDVLAFQSSLLEGSPTAGLVPATARANRADTLSQTAERDFSTQGRRDAYGAISDPLQRYNVSQGQLVGDSVATRNANTAKVQEETRGERLGNDYNAWLNRISGVGGEREAFTYGGSGTGEQPAGVVRSQEEALRFIMLRDGLPPEQAMEKHSDLVSHVMTTEEPMTLDQYENQRAKALGGVTDFRLTDAGFTGPSGVSAQPQGKTLYDAAGEAHGFYPTILAAVSRIAGQIPGMPIAEDTLEARQMLRTAAGELRRTLSINPRFPEGEMNRLMEEFNSILPSAFNSGPAAQQDLRTIAQSIAERIAQFETDARNELLDVDTRQQQYNNANAMRSFLAELGAPQDGAGDGAGPQPGAVEDGYRFLGGDPANPASWEPVQ